MHVAHLPNRRTRRPRIFDVRAGEGRVALYGFAVLLLLIITAHTVLETARDALLLTGPGPRALGLVYIAIAGCTLPAAALAAKAGARFGVRRALAGTISLAAMAVLSMFALPMNHASAVAVYVVSGVIASVVVPQFWTLVGTVLTVAQGRRLFGLIASAGVFGGVLGSGTAAAAMLVLPVKALLVASAAIFALSVAALGRLRLAAAPLRAKAADRPARASVRSLRGHPFLIRVALIVFLSTATLLAVDYFFKSTVARNLPPAEVGPFVARYYLALNGASLLVQLFVGSALVRTVGIPAAIALTPLLLFLGCGWAVIAGGTMLVVLVVKAIDGALRHSIHRITGELMYLPVASNVRATVKPLIDGALGRTAQTVTGATLLALGGTWALSPRPFAVLVTTLAFAWLLTAVTMRRPYLGLLRRAISAGSLNTQDGPAPIDLESAQLLVQHLASEDAFEVVAAMNALSRRGREGFVPALVLLHQDEMVLVHALEMFGASSRTDWTLLARKLLDHPRESVRMAAARALAMHSQLDPDQLASDVGSRMKGYAAVHILFREATEDVVGHPRIAALLALAGEAGEQARLGLLAAVADAPPNERLTPLLLALGAQLTPGVEGIELFARAAARQRDVRLIPRLVALLPVRAGRESVREALVALGEPAFEQVHSVLLDTSGPRSLRVHIPKTLARFGTKQAADCLLANIETEGDAFVQYKSIRALGVLVGKRHLAVDRVRLERLARAHLLAHFRMLGLRAALEPLRSANGGGHPTAAQRLLVGLIDDKLRQSLERAFQLLKAAHPREDIHRVHLACLSGDAYARANAGEFLDALLWRRDQQSIRALLRLITDDLPVAQRVSRAASFVPYAMPPKQDVALTTLMEDVDPTLAALAGIYALEFGSDSLRAAVDHARRHHPEIDLGAGHLLQDGTPVRPVSHG